jgi:hypothetical protein
MKLLGFVLAAVLLAGTSASAQITSPSLLMPSSAATSVSATSTASGPEPAAAAAVSSEPAAAPEPNQQGPIGVYESYNFQAYLGYTFLRFYEAPHQIQSRNGFDTSISYYYHGGTFGAIGEMVGAFGSQFNENSRFVFAGGGPQARWSAPRAVEIFAHGLVGGSHYVPQTAFGGQHAFAYEVGGGVDIAAHHQRLSYRAEIDMIGTRYFNTYQYSPKASVGVIFKF